MDTLINLAEDHRGDASYSALLSRLAYFTQLFGVNSASGWSRALFVALFLYGSAPCHATHTLFGPHYWDTVQEATAACAALATSVGVPSERCFVSAGMPYGSGYTIWGGWWCTRYSAPDNCQDWVAIAGYACASNSLWDLDNSACLGVIDVYRLWPRSPDSCSSGSSSGSDPSFGNPIKPLIGAKVETLETGISLAGIPLVLKYDSSRYQILALTGSPQDVPAVGPLWSSSWHRGIFQAHYRDGGQAPGIVASRGDGTYSSFSSFSAPFIRSPASTDRFDGTFLFDPTLGLIETYQKMNLDYQAISIQRPQGPRLKITLSKWYNNLYVVNGTVVDGLVMAVSDDYDRTVKFGYSTIPAGGDAFRDAKITSITDPSGGVILLGYDEFGNLERVTWQDGRTRRFLYQKKINGLGFMTGIVDEANVNYSIFSYQDVAVPNFSGGATTVPLAVSTQRAGGVDAYSASYATPPIVSTTVDKVAGRSARVIYRYHDITPPVGTQIRRPNGTNLPIEAVQIAGYNYLGRMSQPAGSGCAASASAYQYDNNGNVTQKDDFNGGRTCFSNDSVRRLEVVRVEGLPGSMACSTVAGAGAGLPPGSRKISTRWHPDWQLPLAVAESGQLTFYVYNGQSDPFSGNAPASCAPSAALLPDGKPIAVLCKKVKLATSDLDGSQGFNAALQPGVAIREEKWSYNRYGQVLTYDGPRTDVSDVTYYSYYSDTNFTGTDPNAVGHTAGDLQSVTNPAGQMTRFTRYNKRGQVLQIVDPNGVTTIHNYDLRQKLLSTTVGSETTNYLYDGVGQIKRIIRPDASYIGFDYDSAHRLVAIYDSLGNRIDYTLDAEGNRLLEETRDPSGAIAQRLRRTIDALGRVQEVEGRP